MTAVFTYKKPSRQIYNFPVDQYKWIVKAISAAKEVGYNTCLYTDDQEFAQGLVLDELHFISDEYNIWDSFKIYVLENRTSTDYFSPRFPPACGSTAPSRSSACLACENPTTLSQVVLPSLRPAHNLAFWRGAPAPGGGLLLLTACPPPKTPSKRRGGGPARALVGPPTRSGPTP